MQSPLNLTPCLLLGAILLGAPLTAGAQTEGDATDAPCAAAAPDCLAQPPTTDTRTRVDGAAGDHHEAVFHAVSTGFIVVASTDLSLSMYQIGRGAAREGAFGAQWQDSPVAFALTKSAMAAGFAYGLQRMHKTRPKTALILGIAATAIEGWLTVRSARLSPAQP